jgi:hypothetical protein
LASRKNKAKKKAFSIGAKMFPIAKALSAPIPFIEQISAKHRQTMGSAFSNAPTTQKLKILSNIVTGSITGINFFSDEFQAPQTLNPSGVLNKWTSAGALGIAYQIVGGQVNKMVGKRVIPETSKIGSISKGVLVGGALGGFFDDPPESRGSQGQRSMTGTRNLSPEPVLQTSKINSGTVFSSGSDSSESAFC